MEWKVKPHKTERVVRRFLFLPKKIGNQGKWLCFATIRQLYGNIEYDSILGRFRQGWSDYEFVG